MLTAGKSTTRPHLKSKGSQSRRLDRPHRSLVLETPAPRPRQADCKVVSRPVLNGLHHVYERAA